ncbi:CCDC66 domain-containing protein [Pseudoscourfieldia marina]
MRRWRLQAAEGLPDGANHPKGGFGSHANIGTRLAPPGSKKGPGGGGGKGGAKAPVGKPNLMTKAAAAKYKTQSQINQLDQIRRETAAAEKQLREENAAMKDLQAQITSQAEDALARERAAVRLLEIERRKHEGHGGEQQQQHNKARGDVLASEDDDAGEDDSKPYPVGAGPSRLIKELRLQVADPAGRAPAHAKEDQQHNHNETPPRQPQQQHHTASVSPARGRGGGYLSSVAAMYEGNDEAMRRLQEKERQRAAYRAELEEQVRQKQAQRAAENGGWRQRGRRMDGASAAAAAAPFQPIPEEGTVAPPNDEMDRRSPFDEQLAAEDDREYDDVQSRAAGTPYSAVSAAPTPRSNLASRDAGGLGPVSPHRAAVPQHSPASRPGGFLSSVAVMHLDHDEAARELREREEKQRAYALELEEQVRERKEREKRRKQELRELELKEDRELEEQARRAAKGYASSVPGLRMDDQRDVQGSRAGGNEDDSAEAAAPATPDRAAGGWPSSAQESERGYQRRGAPSPAPPTQVMARALPPPADSFGQPGGAASSNDAQDESIAGDGDRHANALAAMPAAAAAAANGGIGPSGLDALARLLEQQAAEAAALRQEAKAAQREREAMRAEMEELKRMANANANANINVNANVAVANNPGKVYAPVRDSLDGFSVESVWVPANPQLAPFGTGFWEQARKSVSSHGVGDGPGGRGGGGARADEEARYAPAPRRDTHTSPAKPQARRRDGGGGDLRSELLENERRRKQLMKDKRAAKSKYGAGDRRKPPARWL